MKKILVFVSTVDGKITKWGNPHIREWSSRNDQEYFNRIWDEAPVVIMGSNTYNAEPLKPSAKHHMVVMTHQPELYKDREVGNQLTFTNETPSQLVNRFEKEELILLLVVGGANVATSFLREELIDELWLTIEPRIFGMGSSFVIEEKLDINLQLKSMEKVNEQGTLIVKYKVVRGRKD